MDLPDVEAAELDAKSTLADLAREAIDDPSLTAITINVLDASRQVIFIAAMRFERRRN